MWLDKQGNQHKEAPGTFNRFELSDAIPLAVDFR